MFLHFCNTILQGVFIFTLKQDIFAYKKKFLRCARVRLFTLKKMFVCVHDTQVKL